MSDSRKYDSGALKRKTKKEGDECDKGNEEHVQAYKLFLILLVAMEESYHRSCLLIMSALLTPGLWSHQTNSGWLGFSSGSYGNRLMEMRSFSAPWPWIKHTLLILPSREKMVSPGKLTELGKDSRDHQWWFFLKHWNGCINTRSSCSRFNRKLRNCEYI